MILAEKKGRFFFDPKDPIYHDHFPNQPVVPGTLIIEAFLKAVDQINIKATAIKRFRFMSFVSPGTYTYKLKITASSIDCYLLNNEQRLVVGKILYDP